MARPPGIGSLIQLDLSVKEAGQPIFRHIYRELRQAILDRRLTAGARLPASRFLAHEIGVSRNTVLSAYDQLASEGFLELRHRSGVFVADTLPSERQGSSTGLKRSSGRPPPLARRTASLINASRSDLRAPAGSEWSPCFQPGLPDVSSFPFALWSRLLARPWRQGERSLALGGDPGGHADLRIAIADYLRTARGIDCTGAEILIVSGIRQALDLTCRLLLDVGDSVWMENPGYSGIRAILGAAGMKVVSVPVDGDGIDVARGKDLAGKARLACVAPSHQYPLGVVLSLQRRLELLDWARSAQAWILEDDYDSEFRYAGRPLAALRSLDADGRVIYVGSLSKMLFPSLRLGYLVVPPRLIQAFRQVRAILDDQPSMTAQPALAEFIRSGHLSAHIRRMRQIYAGRQRIFLDGATRHLGDLMHFAPDEAGLHLTGRLPPERHHKRDQELAAAAAAAGITVAALSSFDAIGDGPRGLMFGYAAVPERLMEPALKRLAQVWDRK